MYILLVQFYHFLFYSYLDLYQFSCLVLHIFPGLDSSLQVILELSAIRFDEVEINLKKPELGSEARFRSPPREYSICEISDREGAVSAADLIDVGGPISGAGGPVCGGADPIV